MVFVDRPTVSRQASEYAADVGDENIDGLLDVLAACSSSLEPEQLIERALPAISRLLDHDVWLLRRRADAPQPRVVARCLADRVELGMFTDVDFALVDRVHETEALVREHGAVAVPLVCDDDQLGALLLVSRQTDAALSERAPLAIAATLARALVHAERFSERVASERRSWDVLDNTHAVIFVKDLDGRYVLVNRQLERDTGLPRAQILGKTDFELFSRETAERLRADDRRVLDSGEPLEVEGVTTFPDGPRVFLTHKFPLRDASGLITGLCGIGTDITARKHVERQLLRSQKLDAVGRLAGGIAHAFNNMLTGILASAELVGLWLPEPHAAGIDEALARIVEASHRAATLTRRLMTFAGEAHCETETVDVHDVIERAVEPLRSNAEHPIELVLELHARVSEVVGDPTRLRAALLDLALNARDAMPHGGTLTITTANVELDELACARSSFALRPGPYVEIRLRDTGIGMAPDPLAHAFEPFFTTMGTSRSGLGLPAVRGTIIDHHGAIELDSASGRGTSVTLRLPTTPVMETPTPSAIPASPTAARKVALLVDDEPLLRKAGKRMLESLGYRVVLAAGGCEGVARFGELHDELGFVLLDMVMPDMDGQAVFEAMLDIDPEVPIIACSGYTAEATVTAMQQRRLAGFLAKPYRLAELTAMLARLADR